MTTAIRKHLRDFLAVAGLSVIALLTVYVLLQQQRLRSRATPKFQRPVGASMNSQGTAKRSERCAPSAFTPNVSVA